MKSESTPEQIMIEAARTLTPSEFITWLEDHFTRFPDRKIDIDIVNRDEVFNMNRDRVLLKVNDTVFVYDHGVFQHVL